MGYWYYLYYLYILYIKIPLRYERVNVNMDSPQKTNQHRDPLVGPKSWCQASLGSTITMGDGKNHNELTVYPIFYPPGKR